MFAVLLGTAGTLLVLGLYTQIGGTALTSALSI